MPVRGFEECRFPPFVVATGLARERRHVFGTGVLISAVQASCASPILFENVGGGESRFAGGGLADKVPLDEFVAGQLALGPRALAAAHDYATATLPVILGSARR